MFSDLQLALRHLVKAPGFAVVAVMSLALGIGANTAVFSLIDAVLIQQLPVRNPQELVIFNWLADENVTPTSLSGEVRREPGSNKTTGSSFSIPTWEAWQKQDSPLTDIFAFSPLGGLTVKIDGVAEIVPGGQGVTGNYHVGLGVTAAAGRLLTADDDLPTADPVAVISFAYWQRRFGGDPGLIGKVITVNGVPVSVVGVTAPAFNGAMQVGEVVNLTLPLSLTHRLIHRGESAEDDRRADYWWVRIMGRLKPGATAEQARASLEGIFRSTARGNVRMIAAPGTPGADTANIPLPQLRVAPGGQGLYEARHDYERSLRLLLGMVGLVLLVACANVANLLLARGEARRREIALRLALGASRARIVRQLLAESLLLASLGAVVGLVFAAWGARALLAMRPFGSALLQLDPSLDGRVLGFTFAMTLVTSVVFGLAPALRATRLNLTSEFQGGARTLGAGSRSRLTKSLMVVQVALSLVLLIGAGLFIRTLRNLQAVDVGFNRENLLLFQVNATANGITGAQALALYDRVRERLATLPTVRQASYAKVAPLSQGNWSFGISVPGYGQTAALDNLRINAVQPAYLATMEIPLLRGRDFTVRDGAGATHVAIINQSFAKKYFGNEDVIGRSFSARLSTGPTVVEIVGLVRDTRYADVRGAPPPVALFPYAQISPADVVVAHFVVRFAGGPAAMAASVRAAVAEVDPGLPLSNLRTQQQQIDRLFAQEQLFANLCSVFGGLALVLAAVGLYGLMAYSVMRRTSEIGLRLALGALPSSVLGMILRESLAMVSIGVTAGVLVALGVTRWISALLFGLSASDPFTYLGMVGLMFTVASVACVWPARQAARTDPMIALRTE